MGPFGNSRTNHAKPHWTLPTPSAFKFSDRCKQQNVGSSSHLTDVYASTRNSTGCTELDRIPARYPVRAVSSCYGANDGGSRRRRANAGIPKCSVGRPLAHNEARTRPAAFRSTGARRTQAVETARRATDSSECGPGQAANKQCRDPVQCKRQETRPLGDACGRGAKRQTRSGTVEAIIKFGVVIHRQLRG